ncbi:hypothetical protein BP6252_03432 [Coleophoma cylindrospora]|uniref:Glycosyltransferase family 31 protein n=1 Tax=Coleophoma cylindrospora TaxID=1849047 RepID=A0A3D8S7Y8_9HELO|nr:hypothetical protein BP6252_03432 [Coleophoma cylindrospora]
MPNVAWCQASSGEDAARSLPVVLDREKYDALFQYPPLRRRAAKLFLAIALFFVLLIALDHRFGEKMHLHPGKSLDLSHLEEYDLSPTFSYSQRIVKTVHDVNERKTLTFVNESLFASPPIQIWRGNLSTNVPVTMLPPLPLSIPSDHRSGTLRVPKKYDSAMFSFGVATSWERLADSIPQFSHWLGRSQAQLHALVPPDGEEKRAGVETAIRELEMNITITPSDLRFSLAYFSLVKHLYERRTQDTKWLVLIDDDTFIPSLTALAGHLSTNYDASTRKVVSALTDNFNQVHSWGLIPYGGGGIFVSVPLAAQISQPQVFDQCLQSGGGQGDGVLMECLMNWSEARPTYDPALNQMDIKGNPDGLFESGRRMLTTHHWKSWFHVDMHAVSRIWKACGEEGILMRFRFNDGIVLSNGYSIVEYGTTAEDLDFHAVELTWDGSKGEFLHRLGPIREAVPKDKKKTYRMRNTTVLEGGSVRQTYIHEAPIDDERPEERGEDSVLELVWLEHSV